MGSTDPFDELREGLRGGDGGGGRRVDVRHLLLGGGGVVLIALAVVVVTAARPTSPPPGEHVQPLAPVEASTTVVGAAQVWPGEPVEVVGNEVRSGGHRWTVGGPGDLVAVGDWDCDGTPTPALVRLSTGRLHVFTEWAEEGAESVAIAGPEVPPDTTGFEASGCGAALVHTAGGGSQRIDVEVEG